ncbi:hypothetical protein FRB99_007063, partial [Tulasnella sp. 403]
MEPDGISYIQLSGVGKTGCAAARLSPPTVTDSTYAAPIETWVQSGLALVLSPLLWAPVADTYGRRTIMITGCFIAFVASIGAGLTDPERAGYSASRFFMGLGAGPASCVGLQMLQDVSFAHERAQKVGVWTFAMNFGLLMGTIIWSFIPWIPVSIFGLLFLSLLAFLPETAFPRRFVHLDEAAREGFIIMDPTDVVPSIARYQFLNLRPIPGLVAPRRWDYILRFFRTFSFPNVAVSIMVYAWGWFGTFCFALSLLESAPFDSRGNMQLYAGVALGAFLSEIFVSGTLSDII